MSDRSEDAGLIRLPAGTFATLHRALRHDRGGLDAARILRDMGLASGEAFYELFQGSPAEYGGGSEDPSEMESHAFWGRLSRFFEGLGWGRLEHKQLSEGVFAIAASDWAEARGGPANGETRCHFTAGLLADLLHRVSGLDLAVLEVESQATSGGTCTLIVGSPETLEAVYSRMRGGAPYLEAVATLA